MLATHQYDTWKAISAKYKPEFKMLPEYLTLS